MSLTPACLKVDRLGAHFHVSTSRVIPGNRFLMQPCPVWAAICLNHTPLLFLICSVITFSAGLVGYTYSSGQGKVVTLSATVLTSFTSAILLVVLAWEGQERWKAFKRARAIRGSHITGIGTVLAEYLRRLLREIWSTRVSTGGLVSHSTRIDYAQLWRKCVRPVAGALSWCGRSIRFHSRGFEGQSESTEPLSTVQVQNTHPNLARRQSPTAHLQRRATILHTKHSVKKDWTSPLERWRQAAWAIALDPVLQSVLLTSGTPDTAITNLRGSLKYFRPKDRPSALGSSVRELQFSHDGGWLAASLVDGTAVIWKATDSIQRVASIPSTHGRIMWSFQNNHLLHTQQSGIGTWDISVCACER